MITADIFVEGNHVVVTCDGILSDKAKRRNRQPLPRCVGYSSKEGRSQAGLLNDEYCGERSGVVVMMNETDEDKLIEMTRDGMKRPLFSCTGVNLRASSTWCSSAKREAFNFSFSCFCYITKLQEYHSYRAFIPFRKNYSKINTRTHSIVTKISNTNGSNTGTIKLGLKDVHLWVHSVVREIRMTMRRRWMLMMTMKMVLPTINTWMSRGKI